MREKAPSSAGSRWNGWWRFTIRDLITLVALLLTLVATLSASQERADSHIANKEVHQTSAVIQAQVQTEIDRTLAPFASDISQIKSDIRDLRNFHLQQQDKTR